MTKFPALYLAAALTLTASAAPALAQANKIFDLCRAAGKSFDFCMKQTMERSLAGCTAVRKQIKRQKESAAKEGYYLAFAGRKASTITGIRGCGYAWYKDEAKAQSVAMANCKRWEAEYGTGNGDKTCRLMN